MKLRKYMLIMTLGFCLPAVAQDTLVVEAVETSPAVITVPTSPNGRLGFKPCAERCDEATIYVRLTPETRYVIQGDPVNFIDFRKDFYNLRRGKSGYALVSYDIEKKTATRIEVSF